jgi:hypothetical protein
LNFNLHQPPSLPPPQPPSATFRPKNIYPTLNVTFLYIRGGGGGGQNDFCIKKKKKNKKKNLYEKYNTKVILTSTTSTSGILRWF